MSHDTHQPERPVGDGRSDLFISHSSHDKVLVARPLARALEKRGNSVWLDENDLVVGDRLTPGILAGLEKSEFAVLILSLMFFRSPWARWELKQLAKRETTTGSSVILPVWHGIEYEDMVQYAPELADRVAAETSDGIEMVADELSAAMQAWRRRAPERVPMLLDTRTMAQLGKSMQSESEVFATVSNILRVRHEVVKKTIANVR